MNSHVPPPRDSAPHSGEETPPPPPPDANQFQGSSKLFRLLGTDVFIHWSWFLVAWYSISSRQAMFTSLTWNVVEYVAVFGIVLLHEFGHVLGCRSVGGRAERVLLWPLGGLAYVDPPPRPGACLWTTVAGPLVNVILAPIFILLAIATAPAEDVPLPDVYVLFVQLSWINGFMLVFNLLPIFPMDGGRILQALLWFALGQGKSLAIASVVGIAAGVTGAIVAVMFQQWWLAMMAGFLVLGAYGGLKQSKRLMLLDSLPQREELACPHCGSHPPIGPFWLCAKCRGISDAFESTPCPAGGTHLVQPVCPTCGRPSDASDWVPQKSPK